MNDQLLEVMSLVAGCDAWIAVDCETTGLPPRGRLIELGAIFFDRNGNVLSEFHEMAKPPNRIPHFITRLTGITDDDLIQASVGADVVNRFLKWLPEDIPLLAHNILFDLQILATEVQGVERLLDDRSIVDTVHIARALGGFCNYRLETIAVTLDLLPPEKLHRARSDVKVVRDLFLHALSVVSDSRRSGPSD